MVQDQKNHRKMYSNVLYFLLHAGTWFLGIKRINTLVQGITQKVKAIDDEAKLQKPTTTVLTRTRTEVKKEAAEKAEVLRGLTVELTEDDKLKSKLAKPVSSLQYGAEAAFLTYCQTIVDGVQTLKPADLDPAETGYDPQILVVLQEDLQALNESTGEVLNMRKAAKTSTDKLVPLFAAVETDLVSLDRFVRLQRFAQTNLVEQYDAVRVLPKTPVHHVFRAKGATPFDVPQLAFNILEHDVPTPLLYNDGGRGHEVLWYLGATADSRPRPGQGLLLKNGKKRLVEDYAVLGDPSTEAFVLVMQTSELAAGAWRVRG